MHSLYELIEAVAIASESHSTKHYGDVIRMENYNFFIQALQPICTSSEGSGAIQWDLRCNVLIPYLHTAFEKYITHRDSYFEYLFAHEFGKLEEIFEQINERIVKVGMDDVHIYIPNQVISDKLKKSNCSRKEVTENIGNLYKRLHKNLCQESGLSGELWYELSNHIMSRFEHYENVILHCYSMKFEPPTSVIQSILKSVEEDPNIVASKTESLSKLASFDTNDAN